MLVGALVRQHRSEDVVRDRGREVPAKGGWLADCCSAGGLECVGPNEVRPDSGIGTHFHKALHADMYDFIAFKF